MRFTSVAPWAYPASKRKGRPMPHRDNRNVPPALILASIVSSCLIAIGIVLYVVNATEM